MTLTAETDNKSWGNKGNEKKKSRRPQQSIISIKGHFLQSFKALICLVSFKLNQFHMKQFLLFRPVLEVNGDCLLSQYKQTFIYYLCNMRVSFSRIIELTEYVFFVERKIKQQKDNLRNTWRLPWCSLTVYICDLKTIFHVFTTFPHGYCTVSFCFIFDSFLMTFCNILMTVGFPRPSVKVRSDECVSWFDGWFGICV